MEQNVLHVFTSHVSSETKHGQTAERSSMEAGQSPSFLRKQWKQFQGRCLSLKQSCKSHWADITLGIDLHTLSIIIIYDNDYHINMIMIIISYTFDYIYIYTVYIYIYTHYHMCSKIAHQTWVDFSVQVTTQNSTPGLWHCRGSCWRRTRGANLWQERRFHEIPVQKP